MLFSSNGPVGGPASWIPIKKVRMPARYPFSAVQVYLKIREQGFDGGYTIVKGHFRKVRPKQQAAYLKLSFAPGECARVDWGSYKSIAVGNTTRRLSFFCHCRMMYMESTVSQAMEHFFRLSSTGIGVFLYYIPNSICTVLERSQIQDLPYM